MAGVGAQPRPSWLCVHTASGTSVHASCWHTVQTCPASLSWTGALHACPVLAAGCPSFGPSGSVTRGCVPSRPLALPGRWVGAAPLHCQCHPAPVPWSSQSSVPKLGCGPGPRASAISQHLEHLFSPTLIPHVRFFFLFEGVRGGAQGTVHERWRGRPWGPLLGSSQGSLGRRSGNELIPPRKCGVLPVASLPGVLHLGVPRCQVRAHAQACCPAAGTWGSQQSVGEGTQKSKVSRWSLSPELSFSPALLLGLGISCPSMRLGLRHRMKYVLCEHEAPGLMPEAAPAPGGRWPSRLPGFSLHWPWVVATAPATTLPPTPLVSDGASDMTGSRGPARQKGPIGKSLLRHTPTSLQTSRGPWAEPHRGVSSLLCGVHTWLLESPGWAPAWSAASFFLETFIFKNCGEM